MTIQRGLTSVNDLLSTSLENDILVIRQKQHIKALTPNVEAIFAFYQYIETLLLLKKSWKAMVMFARPDENEYLEYSRFLYTALSAKDGDNLIARLLNVVNFYIRKLSTFNAFTVFAGRGTVSMFHLNLSLAYDYRIFADDTVFENPGADIGLITKGSGYFLPRLIGVRKATEVLQWKTFCPDDALDLGLIDQIVPVSKLEEETMQFVAAHLDASASIFPDIRKLFKCDAKELERSLEMEDRIILDRLKSPDFRKTLSRYYIKKFGCDLEALKKGH